MDKNPYAIKIKSIHFGDLWMTVKILSKAWDQDCSKQIFMAQTIGHVQDNILE